MGSRLERIDAELQKARVKQTEWERRVKELERKYREEENTQIHEMVHAANLTPKQLMELLRRHGEIVAPRPEMMQEVEEEIE